MKNARTALLAAATLLAVLTGCTPGTTATSAPAAPEASAAAATSGISEKVDELKAKAKEALQSASDKLSNTSSSAPAGTPAGASAAEATATLATIPVKGKAPKTGYSRDQFGAAWTDVDHNGCDTRNDILARDLTGVSYKPGTKNCVVASGTLADKYTGKDIKFTRGQDTSSAVQIDHVVALSAAWQTGAQQISADQRLQLANDPINLMAADGPANQQKSDSSADAWLPSNKAFRCEYVSKQIAVKAKYGLWVTQPEHDAMERVLGSC